MIHKLNQFSRFCNTRLDYFLNIQNAKAIGITTSILQMHIRRFETYDILYFLFWKESQPIGQLINTSHVQQLPTAMNNWKYLLQTLRIDSARTQNTCHFLDTEFLIQIIPSSWQFHSTSSSSRITRCNRCPGYSLRKAGCCSGSCASLFKRQQFIPCWLWIHNTKQRQHKPFGLQSFGIISTLLAAVCLQSLSLFQPAR